MSSLQQLKDGMAKSCYGMTKQEAIAQGICVDCKQGINVQVGTRERIPGIIYSVGGVKEYKITGLCEFCYDKIFA